MTGVHQMDICTLCRLRLMPQNSLNDHVVFIHWLHWNINVKAENHRKFVDPDQTLRSYQGLHFAKADYGLYCLSSSMLWGAGDYWVKNFWHACTFVYIQLLFNRHNRCWWRTTWKISLKGRKSFLWEFNRSNCLCSQIIEAKKVGRMPRRNSPIK